MEISYLNWLGYSTLTNKHMKEVFGNITKLETLISLTANVIPGTLVLENQEPYPGYHYSYLPNTVKPQSLFLITNEKLDAEKVYRLAKKVKQNFTDEFQAVPCVLEFFNLTLYGIRIKYLADYSLLEKLQHSFVDVGVKFKKHKKVGGAAFIKVRKNIQFTDFVDDCYKCSKDPNKYYFFIDKKLEFDEFDQITRHVKNNTIDNNFDAAIGAIYSNFEMVDLIRLVGVFNFESIIKIRDAYRKEIKKL